ncbi:hypothetical protein NKR19_g274 [Coniochaeta hoffmannii]|uniref:Uncharacterized protein n=1 Tax=Coniochaeta hoffmannii TaxID=91930 RepID=A0AA38SKI8_9PEZI|nr:hypothetical protein NKR19_g274 [Coniochaeta hoffmannii]
MSKDASRYPIDESRPLHPTKCLYLLDTLSPDLHFVDISTSSVLSALTQGDHDGPNAKPPLHVPAEVHTAAKHAATDAPPTLHLTPKPPASTTFLTRNRTHLAAVSPDDDNNNTPLAELSSGGLWSLGQWDITFPPGSTHCTHDIKLRPVGVGARADWFVKDSVPYFWDLVHVGLAGGQTVYELFKGVDGKRVQVARFEALRARDRSGILWVDGDGADEAVVCVTLVATINRVESFRA